MKVPFCYKGGTFRSGKAAPSGGCKGAAFRRLQGPPMTRTGGSGAASVSVIATGRRAKGAATGRRSKGAATGRRSTITTTHQPRVKKQLSGLSYMPCKFPVFPVSDGDWNLTRQGN